MAEINFSGLASGIDFDSMIKQLVEAEKYQITKLTTWKEEWQEKVDLIQELNNKMDAISSANDTLKTASSFYSKLITSGDETIAVAAADSSAHNGSYNFQVASDSRHILASRGWANADTTEIASGTGSFSFSDGNGKTITVAVDDTMTLDDLKNAIDSGITAQGSLAVTEIVSDGSSSNSYRLQITGGAGGTGHDVVILQDDTLLSFGGNAIDAVENVYWTGGGTASDSVAVDSSSSYTGHVNKRIDFKIISDTGVIGTDEIEIKWTDAIQNTSGTIIIPEDYDGTGSIEVTQGLKLDFTIGNTLRKNNKFAVDLFNSDIQLAQDSGLATAGKVVHKGFVDANSTALTTSSATFSYKYGGSDLITINVAANTTLQGLANLINNSSNNPGVRATVVNDGSGSANAFHLVMTGEDTGAANRMLVSDFNYSGFTNTQFKNNLFEETTRPTNALVKIDDYPPGQKYIQNSSNLITGLVEGVSITAKSAGTTEISVSDDVDAMTEKVQKFVDAYNEAMSYIKEITKVVLNDEEKADINAAGKLVGNYAVNTIENEMKSYISGRASGFEDGVDSFLLLSQMGITTGDDSQLEFDTEVFEEVLQENPEQVVNFFSADKEGVTSHANINYLNGTSYTESGKYQFSINIDGTGKATNSTYWVDGQPGTTFTLKASSDGKYLTAMNGPAKGMALEAINISGPATITGNVRVKSGKAQQYDDKMDELLSETSGITKVLEDNYENIMRNIDKRIEREERRVKMVEDRLKLKYANLETTIQNQNSVMERLKQQISTLPTSV